MAPSAVTPRWNDYGAEVVTVVVVPRDVVPVVDVIPSCSRFGARLITLRASMVAAAASALHAKPWTWMRSPAARSASACFLPRNRDFS